MKNQKGFTMIELVVSFTLISILIVGMLTIALSYRHDVQLSTERLELEEFKNNVTRAIQDDIVEYGFKSAAYCSASNQLCLDITFDDNNVRRLQLVNSSISNRYIQYNGRKFPIEETFVGVRKNDNDTWLTLPNKISLEQKTSDGYNVYKFDITITHADLEGDFGIHIVAFHKI